MLFLFVSREEIPKVLISLVGQRQQRREEEMAHFDNTQTYLGKLKNRDLDVVSGFGGGSSKSDNSLRRSNDERFESLSEFMAMNDRIMLVFS